MEERSGSERGDGGRRRAGARVAALLGIIAVAAGIGLLISRGHPQSPAQPTPQPSLPALQVTPSPVTDDPQSGEAFSLADDLATHDIVLFGGVGDYDNTWLWNGARWTHVHPATSPPGRFGASAAYDPQNRMVLLFGGRTEPGLPIHDTWGWNGTTWEDLDSGAGGPEPGEGSDMAWDSAHDQMVLTTGSGVISSPGATWIWAGTHWERRSGSNLPAGAFYSPMWFDRHADALIAVGCCEGPPPSTGAVNTTWRWNGATWSLLPTPEDAPMNASTMALDPETGSLVLCSCDTPSEPELLTWDGTAWKLIVTGALPVAGGIEITDSDRGQLLLLGSPLSQSVSGVVPVQVWTLNGSNWRRLDTPAR